MDEFEGYFVISEENLGADAVSIDHYEKFRAAKDAEIERLRKRLRQYELSADEVSIEGAAANSRRLRDRWDAESAKVVSLTRERDELRARLFDGGRAHDAEACALGSGCPWCEIERLREKVRDQYEGRVLHVRDLEAEIEQLRELCGAAYMVVGGADGPVEMMDNLSAVANGDAMPHDPQAGLPWSLADAVHDLTRERDELRDAVDRLRGKERASSRFGKVTDEAWLELLDLIDAADVSIYVLCADWEGFEPWTSARARVMELAGRE